jgi:hypothetical protein
MIATSLLATKFANKSQANQAKPSNLCLVLIATSKEEGRNPLRYSSNPEPLMTVD